jgi:hypothetical protein
VDDAHTASAAQLVTHEAGCQTPAAAIVGTHVRADLNPGHLLVQGHNRYASLQGTLDQGRQRILVQRHQDQRVNLSR